MHPQGRLPLRLILIAILAASGCKKSRGDVIEAHRQAVQAKLEKLHQVAAGQPVMAPSTAELEGPAPDFSDAASSNAVVLDREEITDLKKSTDREVPFARLIDDPVRVAKAVMGMAPAKGDSVGSGVKWLDEELARLERARYALALDLTQWALPSPMGTTFSSGRVSGKARLYDLESGKLLVAFRIDARNSSEVLSRADRVIDKLRDNLGYELGEAIIAGIKTIPGATPPTSFGYTSW